MTAVRSPSSSPRKRPPSTHKPSHLLRPQNSPLLSKRRLAAMPPSSPRGPLTGTSAEISLLEHTHAHLKDKNSYHHHDTVTKQHSKVLVLCQAERLLKEGKFVDCQDLCFSILVERPSQAVQAQVYMLLAREEVVPECASERAYYALKAIETWEIVAKRDGKCRSRYPVALAREKQELSRRLLGDAQLDERRGSEVEVEVDEEPECNIQATAQRSAHFRGPYDPPPRREVESDDEEL